MSRYVHLPRVAIAMARTVINLYCPCPIFMTHRCLSGDGSYPSLALTSSGRWVLPRWKTRSSSARSSRCSTASTKKTSSGSRMGSGPDGTSTMRLMHYRWRSVRRRPVFTHESFPWWCGHGTYPCLRRRRQMPFANALISAGCKR